MGRRKAIVQPGFYGGLSGLQLPIPKYLFPPPHEHSSRLTYYASFFNSIEINSSFYKLPMARTVGKWTEQVPVDFKFTFKLWREITHAPQLEFQEAHVQDFFSAIAQATPKMGCVLVQFPPSLGQMHIRQLGALLHCMRECSTNLGWKIAVEFRNNSWYVPDTYDLLQEHNAALVLQDIPKSKTPMVTHTADFIYTRFHGPTGNYRDSYTDPFLAEQALLIREWLGERKTVYCYFNNTMGDAFRNLETLNTYLLR